MSGVGEGPRRIAIAELRARLGVNARTIGRWVKAEKFPAPHYLGTLRRWWLADILAWEAEQMARPVEERRCNLPGGSPPEAP